MKTMKPRRKENKPEQEKHLGTISTLNAFKSSSSHHFSLAPQHHSCNGSDLNQKVRLYERQVSKGTWKGLEMVECRFPVSIRCEKPPQTSANSSRVNCESIYVEDYQTGLNICKHQSRWKLNMRSMPSIDPHRVCKICQLSLMMPQHTGRLIHSWSFEPSIHSIKLINGSHNSMPRARRGINDGIPSRSSSWRIQELTNLRRDAGTYVASMRNLVPMKTMKQIFEQRFLKPVSRRCCSGSCSSTFGNPHRAIEMTEKNHG